MPQLEVSLPTESEGPGFLPSGHGAGHRLEAGCPGSSPREEEGRYDKDTPAPPVQAWECAPEEWLDAGGQW